MRLTSVLTLVGLAAPLVHAQTCGTAWQQCGGANWSGATCCVTGYKCTYQNDWYSQCLLDPSVVTTAPPTTTPAPTTAKPTTSPAPTTTATPTTAAPTTPLNLYPNYNTNPIAADATGMGSNATTLAAKLQLGLNIGNTLEAIGGETAWGNPQITQTYVDAAKAAGFNAIRLPASWNQYANQTTAQINATWLARVKEVVNYCIKDGLYVIVNIHWDGGWLEENCTPEKQAVNNEKQKAFWHQIATALRDFDEHLILAGANEPNVDTAAKMAVLMTYHQTFIDAVRATGGRNAYRNLIVQGPSTDIEKTNSLMTSWVTDAVANRLMAEVHYYTPYQFTLMTADEWWGKQFYYWGAPNHSPTDTDHNPTWGEETDLEKYFTMMKTQFVDKSIPVVLGEFQVQDRKGVTNFTDANLALHEASRGFFYKTIVSRGRALGLIPFVWDTGSLLDRNTGAVKDSVGLNGLLAGLT